MDCIFVCKYYVIKLDHVRVQGSDWLGLGSSGHGIIENSEPTIVGHVATRAKHGFFFRVQRSGKEKERCRLS
jgi:hypothetical protein